MRTQIMARPVLAVGAAAVVVVGAYLAELLSRHMMSAVALVGSWLMFAFVVSCIVTRFRPAVGVPVLVGFAAGTVFVVIVGAGAMMMG